MKKYHSFGGAFRRLSFVFGLVVTAGFSAQAQFTLAPLPNLPTTTAFPSFQPDELPDGRLIYGSDQSLEQESTFGGASFAPYMHAGSWDPSSIDVFDAHHAVIGRGTFGASNIYLFDPSDLQTSFTAIPGVSIQNYTLAYRDAASLYVGGANGSGGSHSISYVTTDGLLDKVIIDNAGPFSGGFAVDAAGNLFVTNAADNKLYKFTKAQLDTAIASVALTLAGGELLTTLPRTGSIAVDSLGRVWSGGYGVANGLDVFDPATGQITTFTPAGDNSNYIVSTFSVEGQGYIGFLDSPSGTSGASLSYGYATVQSVPEPAAGACLGLAAGVCALRRRRRSVLA